MFAHSLQTVLKNSLHLLLIQGSKLKCDQFIATGSKDETIQLYDMSKKTEHGALLHHNGEDILYSCLEFYGMSHLLSGGQDGLICVVKLTQSGFYLFRGRVTSLSVHPSGKLALSVGTDKTLTWNLIEGRSAFIKNLVLWSPDRVDIYILKSATITGTIAFTRRISCVKFLKNTLLAVGGDDESVRIYDVTSQKCVCEFKAHENRYELRSATSTEQSAQAEASKGAAALMRVSASFYRQNPVVSIGMHPSGNFEKILQQVQVGHMNSMH
uniref:PAK1 interacting protein 1 n=1 Tax=Cyprinus carpio TaxID=7962 RepID=A0A8C2KZX0_CYPCA